MCGCILANVPWQQLLEGDARHNSSNNSHDAASTYSTQESQDRICSSSRLNTPCILCFTASAAPLQEMPCTAGHCESLSGGAGKVFAVTRSMNTHDQLHITRGCAEVTSSEEPLLCYPNAAQTSTEGHSQAHCHGVELPCQLQGEADESPQRLSQTAGSSPSNGLPPAARGEEDRDTKGYTLWRQQPQQPHNSMQQGVRLAMVQGKLAIRVSQQGKLPWLSWQAYSCCERACHQCLA